MSREVRRVPKDWQHPTDNRGRYIPLYDGTQFFEHVACWDAEVQKSDARPDPADYMPLWRDDERTHLMMYETISEGMPMSPAFATAEELARWLTDNNANCFGGRVASYEKWLSIIENSGYSVPRYNEVLNIIL